jgi:DNA repair protein REV1
VLSNNLAGAEVNWGLRFSRQEEVNKFLTELSSEVFDRMKQAQVTGKTLSLKVKKRRASASHETVKYLGHGVCDTISRYAPDSSFSNLCLDL